MIRKSKAIKKAEQKTKLKEERKRTEKLRKNVEKRTKLIRKDEKKMAAEKRRADLYSRQARKLAEAGRKAAEKRDEEKKVKAREKKASKQVAKAASLQSRSVAVTIPESGLEYRTSGLSKTSPEFYMEVARYVKANNKKKLMDSYNEILNIVNRHRTNSKNGKLSKNFAISYKYNDYTSESLDWYIHKAIEKYKNGEGNIAVLDSFVSDLDKLTYHGKTIAAVLEGYSGVFPNTDAERERMNSFSNANKLAEYILKQIKRPADSEPHALGSSGSPWPVVGGDIPKIEDVSGDINKMKIKNNSEGYCVADYVGKISKWKNMRLQLKMGINLDEFIEWFHNYKRGERFISEYVSCMVVGPGMEQLFYHIASQRNKFSLFFMINDNHLYEMNGLKSFLMNHRITLEDLACSREVKYIFEEDLISEVSLSGGNRSAKDIRLSNFKKSIGDLENISLFSRGRDIVAAYNDKFLFVIVHKDVYEFINKMKERQEERENKRVYWNNVKVIGNYNSLYKVISDSTGYDFIESLCGYDTVYSADLYSSFAVSANIDRLNNFELGGDVIDISGSYVNSILEDNRKVCIFSGLDEFRDVRGLGRDRVIKILEMTGECLVSEFSFGSFKNKKSVLCNWFVLELIKKGANIKVLEIRLSSGFTDLEVLKDGIKRVKKLCASDIALAKKINNSMTGLLGCKIIKNNKCLFTKSKHVRDHYVRVYGYEFGEVCVDGVISYWAEHREEDEYKYYNSAAAYRHIICLGKMRLFNLIEKVEEIGGVIMGYNTDSVFIKKGIDFSSIIDEKLDDGSMKYKVKNGESCPSGRYIMYEEVTKRKGNGILFTGCAGAGKSYKMKEMYDDMEGEKLIVSKTHIVVNNSKKASSFDDDGTVISSERNCVILDEIFYKNDILCCDVLFIDEISCIEIKHLTLIYRNWCLGNIDKIYAFGDFNQQNPIESKINIRKSGFMNVFKETKEIGYNNNSRYSQELYNRLSSLLKDGNLNVFKDREISLEDSYKIDGYHVTKWNKYMDYSSNLLKKIGKNKLEDGDEVICINNLNKKNGVYNSCLYTVECSSLNGDIVISKDDEEIGLFGKSNFVSSKVISSYKVQGKTLTGNVIIHQSPLMSLNELYVCLSRCKNIENIYIVKGDYNKKYVMEEYNNGVVKRKRTEIIKYFYYRFDGVLCYSTYSDLIKIKDEPGKFDYIGWDYSYVNNVFKMLGENDTNLLVCRKALEVKENIEDLSSLWASL